MDNELKVMIAGTMRALEKERKQGEGIPWETVISVMTQNQLLEPNGDEIVRSDKLLKEGHGLFKFDGSPDPAVVEQVPFLFSSYAMQRNNLLTMMCRQTG